MAIYKSSFNQKPEKEKKEKPVKSKPEKEKKPKTKQKIKVNVPLVLLIAFSLIFLVCLPPNIIKSFLLGVFGLAIYPVCVLGAFFSAMVLTKHKFNMAPKYMAYLLACIVLVWFIFHLILTSKLNMDAGYGNFLKQTYNAKTSAGGVLFSLVSYPAVRFLTIVGAYIFAAIALAIFVGLTVDYIIVDKQLGHKQKSKFDFSKIEDFEKPLVDEPVKQQEKQTEH